MTLNQTPPMKIFCVRHWFTGPRNVQCENQEQKLPYHNVALL